MKNDKENGMGTMTYVDFFSGCGGLSLGLGLAGWRGIFAIEKDPMAFKTFRRNLIDEDVSDEAYRRKTFMPR